MAQVEASRIEELRARLERALAEIKRIPREG